MIKALTNEEQEKRRQKLKQLYYSKGITQCELRLPPTEHNTSGCWLNTCLGFAHKEKRDKYRSRPEDLWTFKETILACVICHDKIEYDRLLTLQVFKKIRENNGDKIRNSIYSRNRKK